MRNLYTFSWVFLVSTRLIFWIGGALLTLVGYFSGTMIGESSSIGVKLRIGVKRKNKRSEMK